MGSDEKKLFFITGHGRSGTHYMACLFTHFGYPVGEQCDKQHGQSHAFPGLWPPEQIRKKYTHLIQVVREPRLVVESTYLANYSLARINWKRVPEIKEGNDLERAIRSVVLWNRAIAEAKPDLITKVEEAPARCGDWLNDIGHPTQIHGKPPATNINYRTASGWNLGGEVPWASVGKEVMEMFNEHCKTYGYPQ
ncbi:MAG: hypothetical protein ACYTAF_08945 [Planctomycetota bacterium]|jgi:hypothetical protein